MEAPKGSGDSPSAFAESWARRTVFGRGKARRSVSPGTPSSPPSPWVQPPSPQALTASPFATACSPSIGRGRGGRLALLSAAERAARPPPQPCGKRQKSAVPSSGAANPARAMPGQCRQGTGTAAVGLPGSSTDLVEEGQPRREQKVFPRPEAGKQHRGNKPKRHQAEDATKGDHRGTTLSLSRKRGKAKDTVRHDGKIALSSQVSQPNLHPDDLNRERDQVEDVTTDETAVSSQPSLDPDDPSHQRDEDQLLDLPQCEVVVRKATSVPGSLTWDELEVLVRAICRKAAEDTKNAWPAANLCLSIIAKEPQPMFIDCLLSSCEDWFENRAERLPRTTRKGSVWWKRQQQLESAGAVAAGPSWKWTAYVAFVAELLVAATGARVRTSSAGTPPFSTTRERAYCLAMLLCDCCQEMLRWPAQDMQEEMACLRVALTFAGRVAELMAPDRMSILFLWLRAACYDHQFPPDVRNITRELANLRCLGWKKPRVGPATNL